jgi:hypothetical protein
MGQNRNQSDQLYAIDLFMVTLLVYQDFHEHICIEACLMPQATRPWTTLQAFEGVRGDTTHTGLFDVTSV